MLLLVGESVRVSCLCHALCLPQSSPVLRTPKQPPPLHRTLPVPFPSLPWLRIGIVSGKDTSGAFVFIKQLHATSFTLEKRPRTPSYSLYRTHVWVCVYVCVCMCIVLFSAWVAICCVCVCVWFPSICLAASTMYKKTGFGRITFDRGGWQLRTWTRGGARKRSPPPQVLSPLPQPPCLIPVFTNY